MFWLEIQNESNSNDIPEEHLFNEWVEAALAGSIGEITIKLVDETTISQLNQQFRQQNKPTDILSFPSEENLFDSQMPYLGDIAICPSQVNQAAKDLNKNQIEHWAHIVIHGVLHLLGYNHQNPEDQHEMQLLENRILQDLLMNKPWNI